MLQVTELQLELNRFGQVGGVSYPLLSREQQEEVLRLRNHPEVLRWSFNQEVISLDQHLAFIESLKNSTSKAYFAVIKDAQILGGISFIKQDSDCLVGMFANLELKNPLAGFILEEALTLIAFEHLGCKKITAQVLPENKSVIALHKKFGFREKQQGNLVELVLEKDRWKK